MAKFKDIYKEEYIELRCPYDKSVMGMDKLLKLKPKENYKNDGNNVFVTKRRKDFTVSIPVYHCKSCGNYYTTALQKCDLATLSYGKREYINLKPNTNNAYHIDNLCENKIRKIIDGTFFIYDRKPKGCLAKKCGRAKISRVYAFFSTKDGKRIVGEVFQCRKCNMYYMDNSLYAELEFPYCINKELQQIIEQQQKKEEQNREQQRINEEKKKLRAEIQKRKEEDGTEKEIKIRRIKAQMRAEEIKNKGKRIQQEKLKRTALKKSKVPAEGKEYRASHIPDVVNSNDIDVSSIQKNRDYSHYQDINPKDKRYQKRRSFFS